MLTTQRRGPPTQPRSEIPLHPPGVKRVPPEVPNLARLTTLSQQLGSKLESKLALHDHTVDVKPNKNALIFNVPHIPSMERTPHERAAAAEELIKHALTKTGVSHTIVRKKGDITIQLH